MEHYALTCQLHQPQIAKVGTTSKYMKNELFFLKSTNHKHFRNKNCTVVSVVMKGRKGEESTLKNRL